MKRNYWGASKQTQDTLILYSKPDQNELQTTAVPRDNIPKPPKSSVESASIEEVEADLMLSFQQAATFRLYEPSETLNKKSQIQFRHKYVSRLMQYRPKNYSDAHLHCSLSPSKTCTNL